MRRQELKLVDVVYCDVCGKACTGAMTTFNQGTPDEKHACHGWIEAEQTRCDLKLDGMLQRGTPIPDAHAAANTSHADVAVAALAQAQRLVKAAYADAAGDSIRQPLFEKASASVDDAQRAVKRAL